jgi:predicted transcriptional regulator of viral defense system
MDNKRALLKQILHENNGMIFTKDIKDTGIPRDYLAEMVSNGELERIERGVYLAADSFDDEMYRLQRKYERAIFSHETALFLHDLSDREPMRYSITVPAGYNAQNLKKIPASVFFINSELYAVGLSERPTAFGRKITCYDMERAICDVIRNRSKEDIAMITGALKRYSSLREKNIPRLMEYAEKFSVVKPIRSYMEVLL